MHYRHLKQRGFSLIELIVVIMILGIIAAISSKVISKGFTAYFNSRNIIDADWQARSALEFMTREIRAILSPLSITTASAGVLTFVDINNNTITYSLSGTSLMRNGTGNQILADGIQSVTFTYFDNTGATTATLVNIRYITISLNVTLNNTNFTVSTSVYPRNLP